ncbi:hypothetical protein SHL15_8064 [Streptomyces hygroscopicus subsp. limoneus]|nr:hypothetical protein SHL15_8064 [Streptomyces hygroscopicus subsp. limoneus]
MSPQPQERRFHFCRGRQSGDCRQPLSYEGGIAETHPGLDDQSPLGKSTPDELTDVTSER